MPISKDFSIGTLGVHLEQCNMWALLLLMQDQLSAWSHSSKYRHLVLVQHQRDLGNIVPGSHIGDLSDATPITNWLEQNKRLFTLVPEVHQTIQDLKKLGPSHTRSDYLVLCPGPHMFAVCAFQHTCACPIHTADLLNVLQESYSCFLNWGLTQSNFATQQLCFTLQHWLIPRRDLFVVWVNLAVLCALQLLSECMQLQ